MEIKTVERHKTMMEQELYFLIAKFLLDSQFKNVAQALIQELENSGKLPDRIDWEGHAHAQGFHELAAKYRHIGPNHLLQVCSRLPSFLEKDPMLVATVQGMTTLLGAGRQSLLRTADSISRPRSLLEYCTRLHGAPLLDAINRNKNNNIVNVLHGRQSGGPLIRKQAIATSFYTKIGLLRQTLGHLSAVYCVLFDRTGKHIVTGADDLLVKLWSAIDGRLLTTFRGASAEITDIAINLENTMIAAGSIDRILRVWDLQNASVIAVLNAHNGMITSVNFCPHPRSEYKYLVTTSTDGSVAFWQYSQPRGQKPIFQTKPTQYHEKLRPGQAQMICASFSPGGMFLAAGSADHHVRVYLMAEDGPKRILEVESHTDTVDSIQWAHSGLRFISGSKDGTALLWRFETQQWKFDKLNMSDRLATCPPPDHSIDLKKGYKVTMVSWDRSDDWVVTAVNDHSIKVWNAKTGKLQNVLRGHTDELYVLESHPKDPHVLLSAGHDGQLFLWDIYKGEKLASFMNTIEGQGHGGIFDAKWSPDGTAIAATDSHGHMLMFGIGSGHKLLKEMPKELFFHTDYRPLVRDANYYVLDEQTQLAPYLMPPPFLVDVDGNPYPPTMQRFVPGRENCSNEQLIPDIGVGETEPVSARSEIDRLIEALANRQQNNEGGGGGGGEQQQQPEESQRNRIQAAVRPPIGVRDQNVSCPERLRTYVKPLKSQNWHMIKQHVYYAGINEMDWYRREMRKRPLMINTGTPHGVSGPPPKKTGRGARKRMQPGPSSSQNPLSSTSGVVNTTDRNNRTSEISTGVVVGRPRAFAHEEDDEDEPSMTEADSSNSDDLTANEEDMECSSESTSDSDSSEYSDWIDVEDQQKLQPPKRSKRKPVERRTYSPADSEGGAKRRGPKGITKIPLMPNGEIPDEYKPPEWLSEVIPKKAPYYPQMGDEVVYFRQGHERYFEHVKNKKLYLLVGKYEPWQQLELREHEICKVIGIKYEIRPPRLCCLKLALMTDDGNMTDKHFTIKYHDIPDVLDFLVLKQTFDTAISRNWGPGDRFRCMIDDKWWIGQIESHQALHDEFPDSLFMCFKVRWDNSEYEFMSPWDMEPIDEDRLPVNVGGSVSVLPEEIQAILYRPKSEEWPRGDREGSCRRIVAGLEQVMTFAIADPFLTPVDLNAYPTYAYVVEYPIDLNTIKARFENHFYRRITSAQFDVRYLATNAEKFNEKHSNIVKHARIITDLCLRILREHNDVDIPVAYHQLQDTYQSSESEDESQPRPSTSRAAAAQPSSSTSRTNNSRRSKRLVSPIGDWRLKCKEILQMIWQHHDAVPFREPVDIVDHPDYLHIIDTPMDLQTVREELHSGNYETPMDFAKDMKLIFQNSRSYNTNQRSRIYAMTLRLSELFEENMKPIISRYKSSKKRDSGGNGSANDKTPKKGNRRATRNNGSAPSTSRKRPPDDDDDDDNDDDDDDDDDDEDNDRPGGRNGRLNGRARKLQSQSNGVSSSCRDTQSGPSRKSRRTNTRVQSSEDDEDDSASTDSTSDESSDGSDESSGIPLAELGKSALARGTRKKGRKQERTAVSSSSQRKSSRAPKRRKIAHDTQEEDEHESEHESDEEEEVHSDNQSNGGGDSRLSRRTRRMPKRLQTTTDDEHKQGGDENRRKRITRRPKRYESDQSFHMERTNRRTVVESDDSDHPRATRESTRKKFREWAVTSDDEDDIDDGFDQKPQTSSAATAVIHKSTARRPSRKKNTLSESENSRKSTRQRVSQSQDDDDTEGSDHHAQISNNASSNSSRPSTSTNIRHSTRLMNGAGSQTLQPISSRLTRRSQLQTTPSTSSLRNDHNYGEAGPSSSQATSSGGGGGGGSGGASGGGGGGSGQQHTLRQTRSTITSRHQRNADELDRSGLEDNNLSAATNNNRLLRLRSANLRAAPTPSSNFEALNGIRRTTRVRTTHNYFEDDNDIEEEEPVVQIQSRISSRSTRMQDRLRQPTDDSDSYSEEDKTPLKMMQSNSKKTHEHNTRNGSSAVNRVKRNLYSDDNSDQAAGPSGRSTRNMKRPHYNEDSEEEKSRTSRRSMKKFVISQSQESESSNGEDEDANGEPSVSSRGRIRKPTAKARGFH